MTNQESSKVPKITVPEWVGKHPFKPDEKKTVVSAYFCWEKRRKCVKL